MSESQKPSKSPPPKRQLHPAVFSMRSAAFGDYHRFDATKRGGASDQETEAIVFKSPSQVRQALSLHQHPKPETDTANRTPESNELSTEEEEEEEEVGKSNDSIHTPVSEEVGKAQNSSDSKKGSPGDNFGQAGTSRYNSSLGVLTKNLVNLIKHVEDGILDLREAAAILQVKKRRLYDITNVLEGIGLMEKTVKNKIQWKGLDVSSPEETAESIAKLQEETQNLTAEETKLDEQIREMQEKISSLSEDENNKKLLFVTKEDINSIPSFQNETLIAVSALPGTMLEVPDPDEGGDSTQRRYSICLRSTMGPIDVYLVSEFEELSSRVMLAGENGADAALDLPSTSGSHENQETATDNNMESQEQGVAQIMCSDNELDDFVNGILNTVPSDWDAGMDYWLLSEADDVSITERWLSEPEVNLNPSSSHDQESAPPGGTTLQQPQPPSSPKAEHSAAKSTGS
ncbi:PREDICTED: transcription factor E2FB-like [Tarenaya hassleriana]|uniref:transcription factor E2FB-like n=1 Tax=Tarenaya hassleriana TaxID=28532 RepID=UPI00053C3C6E|nr:PREDICTED: transcription factor E2FB-like [Tarenaya hassleriana]